VQGLKEMADTRKTALSKRDEQYEELRQENAQLQMNKREVLFVEASSCDVTAFGLNVLCGARDVA